MFLTCAVLNAQSEGVIYGHVKDSSGLAVENADVFIDGTMYSVFTDANGYYELEVEPGAFLLIITGIGFEELTQEVTVNAGERVELSVQLQTTDASTTQLGEAVVVGQANKETESALLNEQRKSVIITENIGAQELERKGVTDVSSAVTKLSGISKQEGSSVVYVRGLGDRYNSTTMNGLPIPSNDPEYKNIDLSIFPTDIVEYIGIDKVYSGVFFGDFAGGNVNINTKTQTGKAFFKVGMTGRVNSNAFNNDKFHLQDGPDFSGFKLSKNPNTLTAYNFENSLNPQRSSTIGSGMSLSGGGRFNVGEQGKIGIFATASFDNDYLSIEEGFVKAVNAQGVANRNYHTYDKYEYNTNSTGLLGVNYRINPKNNVKFNSLYVNSSNQKLEEFTGYQTDLFDNGNDGFIRRGTFVKNTLWVNQLLGDHKFGERTILNWALGYNKIDNDMPDRIHNSFRKEDAGYVVAANSTSNNNRYFQTLTEDEFVGNLSVDYKFSKEDENKYKGKITIGYNGRMKNRDVESDQYSFSVREPFNTMIVDPDNLDAFFNPTNFNTGSLPMSLVFQNYSGKQDVHGGFLNLQYKLTDKFTAVVGLRAESIMQEVEWNTNAGSGSNKYDKIEFLPNLNLKYELNQKQNLRFAASKTYTLPQFKERALFPYEEIDGTTYGWPTTYPSTDYNADLKWEFFPNAGELISVAGFGKYILDPINKFTTASSANDVTYANTGDWGYVFGGEIEVRKNIYKTDSNNPDELSFGVNASYIHTNQELNSEKIFEETLLANGSRLNAQFTNEEDAFQGASDILVNGDLTFSKVWEKGGSIAATVAYNHFSDRIYALGTDQKGNIVEKGFGTLDFILRTKLTKNIGINLNAKNLLDPDVERVQENATGDVTILHYKKGMNFSLNINYEF